MTAGRPWLGFGPQIGPMNGPQSGRASSVFVAEPAREICRQATNLVIAQMAATAAAP
jgi:hypothetical protein